MPLPSSSLQPTSAAVAITRSVPTIRGAGDGLKSRGTSTMTLVDFTAATARSPGSRERSSAASRVISETTRCGPAWISTTAVSLSRSTRVTMPVKRLRADCGGRLSGSKASAWSFR